MSRHAVRRSLLLAPLAQHKGRLALSVLAIALGVALGYAVQLINQAAINEFAAAVQTLSGEADLAVRGPPAGFEESLYTRIARLPEVAERLAERLRREMPAGTLLERPDADIERSGALSRAYRVNLNVLALVALFTGGLLVFSAQALAVVRRRAQLALLRVLGLTRRELVAMLLAEAAIVGAMGALAGIALGHASAALVLERFGAELRGGYFRGLAPSPVLDWPALALFFSLGILAAVLGSLAPALEAAAAAPAPALKAGDEERALRRLQPVWPGIAVLFAGTALTQAGPVSGLPLFRYGAIALLLIGTVMLMPRIAVLGFRVAPLLGPESARIGLAQLRRAPGQAGVSLAALDASVSLMVSMAIMVASFRQSLDEWLERMLPADLYVRAGPGSDTAFLSPADQRTIAALPRARRVEVLRSQRLVVAPDRPPLALLARLVEAEGRVPPLLGAAHPLKPGDPPAASVSEVASDIYGWKPGAVIELPLGGRHARFTVAGIWRDYARQQGAVLIERYEYLRHTGDAYANDAPLWLGPGADPASPAREIEPAAARGRDLEISRPPQVPEVS